MSKTKKRMFYSVIVAVAVLLAFVAVTVFTAPDVNPVVSEVADGQTELSTATINPSNDSDYNSMGIKTSMTYPGTFTGRTQQGSQVSDAGALDSALKTGGTYYLTKNISYTASLSNTSAATSGTFSGVLYGNGYTVTVTVPNDSKYSWANDGSYGFLVKNLTGTIRDLNVVIVADSSKWTKFGFNTSESYTVGQVDGESAHMQNIGGIAGNMNAGLIHNCKVTYTGYLWLISNGAEPAVGNAWSTANMANIFGGVAGRASGGIISYTTVQYDGRVINAGQQRGDGTNHLMISTGGVVGQIGNGAVNMKKITVQGGGWIAAEAHTYSRGMFNYPYTDVLTGGIVGWVSSASNANLQINGVYLNLTYFSAGADSGAYSGATASNGNAGGVKSYYASYGGINKMAFSTYADSIYNDYGGNTSSDAYASEMRTSYGIGAIYRDKGNDVSLNNVYVSSVMADTIQAHHPFAAHQIEYGQDSSNTYWDRWNWVYTVVDTATLGTEFAFAPTTSVSDTYNHTTGDIGNLVNNQRGIYFKVSNQSKNSFVYNIRQGTETTYDLYQIYSKTYNNFGDNGTLWVPAMYAGYKNNVKSEVRGYNTLSDTTSDTVTTYVNTVSAEFGSYLYMDYYMTNSYGEIGNSGSLTRINGYTGSGNNYTYVYDGDMLYVPAFAGYKNVDGTGDPVIFTEDDLNNIGMSSTQFTLTSSDTIVSSQEKTYTQYNWLQWRDAGNVGTYSMTYNWASGDPSFITMDGDNYYCSFKDSYPTKTIEVVPYEAELIWNSDALVYDGTGKDVSVSFGALPSSNGLGNDDTSKLGISLAYSAENEALLNQNKPYHAGDYTATVSLTYDGSTENVKAGNFTVTKTDHAFSVGKVQISVTPEDMTSYYGDDHAAVLAGAKTTSSGNWVSDDKSYFNFTVKTVVDTINFATQTGEYPTTVEASLADGAVPELLTDYEFVVTNGKLVINARPINGTLILSGGVYNGGNYAATLSLDDGVRVSTDKVFDLDYVLGSDTVEIVSNAGEYLVRITPEANKYTLGMIIIDGKDELYAYGESKLVVEQRSVDVTLSFDNGYVYDGTDKVTAYSLQSQEGDAGVLPGEDALESISYNGGAEAIMPADYIAAVTFGNPNYKAGAVDGGTFTIEKAELAEIRIDNDYDVYDGTEKSVAYTLVGVADEEDIESLAGNVTVTYNRSTSKPVNADVYAVEISVAEGTAYKAASTSVTFTVDKAEITFVPVTETVYTGRNIEPEYSITAPGMSDASSLKNYVTVSHTVILNASNYEVTLSFAGTGNYKQKEERYWLEVSRADLVIGIDDNQTLTYNGNAQMPVYGISAVRDDDEYGAVSLTLGGSKVVDNQAINAADDYTLTISVEESVNYNAAQKTVNFTIEKYNIVLIGASEQFVPVQRDEDNNEITSVSSYFPSLDIEIVDATGCYTKEADLHYATGETDLTFAEGKAVFTVEITMPSLDTANYSFDGAVITVNVLDATISITVNGVESAITSVTFGDALTIEAKGSYGDGAQEEDVQSVVWYAKGADGAYDDELGADAPVNAGEYMALFTYTFGPDSNYVTRNLYLKILPKAVTVTLNGAGMNVVYGDDINENSFVGATYSSTDTSDPGLVIEYSTTAEKFSPAGESYPLNGVVTGVSGGEISNYIFTVVPGSFEMERKTVWVKADDVTAIYGDDVIFSAYKVYVDDGVTEWADYAGASQLKVSFSAGDGILIAGNYDIEISAVHSDYIVVPATTKGVLTVERRSITIIADAVSVEYGTAELPEISGSITGGNLVNGDSLGEISAEWTGAETLGVLDVNSYLLSDYATLSAKLDSAQEGTNYDIAFETSTMLNVYAKRVVITFIGWQSDGMLGTENVVTYNANTWSLSGIVDGIVNDDDVFVVCEDGTDVMNAGTYTRNLVLDGADAGNYVADAYSATLEIKPYKTVISVGQTEYSYIYGDTKTAINPTLSVLEGDSYDGSFVQKNFVGTNTGVTGTQVVWDDIWNAGSYTVVVSYAGTNYEADPVSISVTVNKKALAKVDAYNGGNLGSSVYNATNVEITAASVADLKMFAGLEDYLYLVFTVGDTQSTVVRNAGIYTIDLRLAENTNYEVEGGGTSLLNELATYEIVKASGLYLSFSLSKVNKVFDGSDMTDYIKSVISVMGINGELVTGATLTLTVKNDQGTETAPLNSGVYSVEVSASAMTNYEDSVSPYSVGNFTIDKVYVAIDKISLQDKTVTYDTSVHSLAVSGIDNNAVLKNVAYEYVAADYYDTEGAVNAGAYNVTVTLLFDKLNTRFSEGVSLESYTDETYGEVYKYQNSVTLTINAATPVINVDRNSTAAYFDGYKHAIEFVLKGVGTDDALSAAYDISCGAGQSVVIDGLGSFAVRYYTDSSYNNLLADGQGNPALPLTVLLNGGTDEQYYYVAVMFTSDNPNYSDFEFRNTDKKYDMTLMIMRSIVTLKFSSVTVPYGQLRSPAEANSFVNANIGYTYDVNDLLGDSVDYDPKAMLEISYNINQFDVNAGSYDIAVSAVAKSEFADSVSAVISNAGSIKLNIVPGEVPEKIKSVFTDVFNTYGNKTYTAADFAKVVKDDLNNDVAYSVSYNGDPDFVISDAGEYVIDVSIPEGNFKAWTGEIVLHIAQVSVNVVWTMGGESPVEGKFTKTYDGLPADIALEVVGADGITASCVYLNSEGGEIDAQYVVGTHRVKAVLSDSNYYVSEDTAYMTVVIEAIVLDEETIRGWISDDSDVYGSVQGIDITGLPAGYGATSIVYVKGDDVYDMDTIKGALTGVYEATVTVSNGTSSGSATFGYTIKKRTIVFTVDATSKEGVKPVAEDVTFVTDKDLAYGDSATVTALTFTDAYDSALAFGVYDMKTYVASVTVTIDNADCYDYSVSMRNLTITPSSAPEVVTAESNHNTVTVTFENEGMYAYKLGSRGKWVEMSSPSDTMIVTGLEAEKDYSLYVAYVGFTSITSVKVITTTADPAVLSQMIDNIMEGGLSEEKQQEFDNIVAYYEKISEGDKLSVQSEYEALVAQFNALGQEPEIGGGDGEGADVLVIVVCAICLALIVISIAGVVVAAVLRKRRNDNMFRVDDNFV